MKEQLAKLALTVASARQQNGAAPELQHALDAVLQEAEQLAQAASALGIDAQRYRTMVALMQRAYEGQGYEQADPHLTVEAQMVMGRRDYRLVTATLTWSDVRDEPLDLGSALDTVPVDRLTLNT